LQAVLLVPTLGITDPILGAREHIAVGVVGVTVASGLCRRMGAGLSIGGVSVTHGAALGLAGHAYAAGGGVGVHGGVTIAKRLGHRRQPIEFIVSVGLVLVRHKLLAGRKLAVVVQRQGVAAHARPPGVEAPTDAGRQENRVGRVFLIGGIIPLFV